jgi:hypothetical protein
MIEADRPRQALIADFRQPNVRIEAANAYLEVKDRHSSAGGGNRNRASSYTSSGDIMKTSVREICIEQSRSAIDLGANDSVEFSDPIGYRVACLSGSIWISCSQRAGSTQVSAGQSVVLQCAGRTKITSLAPARLELTEEAPVRLGLGRLPRGQVLCDHL